MFPQGSLELKKVNMNHPFCNDVVYSLWLESKQYKLYHLTTRRFIPGDVWGFQCNMCMFSVCLCRFPLWFYPTAQ